MNAEQLRNAQAPLKAQYQADPASAFKTLHVKGEIDPVKPSVHIDTHGGRVEAGMHSAAGGSGEDACPAEMLLEALIGCAGITFKAVAIAMGIAVRKATVHAEADLDFRGTLGIDRQAPAGFSAIRLRFEVDADVSPEQLKPLLMLSERYCAVYQTLLKPPAITVELDAASHREPKISRVAEIRS